MNALRHLHAALVPGGVVLDTQPVSALPPIETDAGPVGALDMREWAQTIAAVDARVEQAIAEGLFDVEEERRFNVTDLYDDGAGFLAETREWQGTRIEDALAERVSGERRSIRLHQEIRLRVLRAVDARVS